MSLFQRASRQKIRFATNVGKVGVEELWDLPLTALDGLAQNLHAKVSTGETTSFIDAPNTSKEFRDNKLKFELVKTIIETRLSDKEVAEKSAATKARKQRVLALIDKKKEAELEDLSVEELEALIK